MTTATLPLTPRRRLILALGVPLALAAIGSVAYPWAVQGVLALANQDQIHYKVAFSVPARTDAPGVTVTDADLTVAGQAGNQIAVRGSLRASYTRPTFSYKSTPSGLILRPGCRVPAGSCSMAFRVALPDRAGASATDNFGDLHASGLDGAVRLTDNSGDLTASSLSGQVSLDDEFGDLNASGLSGTLNLASSSGDVTATGLTGNTTIHDSFGEVTVTGLSARELTCTDESGDITISFRQVPRRVTINDRFGDVTLKLPPGPATYRVSTATSFGNRSVTVPQSPTAANVITVANASGDISVVNSGAPDTQPTRQPPAPPPAPSG
jgi:hypothetical protein